MKKKVVTAEEQQQLVQNTRAKAVAALFKVLEKHEEIAGQLEKAVWNNAIDVAEERKIKRIWFLYSFRILYTSKLRSLMFNIGHEKNTDLKRHIIDGLIDVKTLPKKSAAELFPLGPAQQTLIALENKAKIKSAEIPEGLLTCRKCKSRRVVWKMLQTRCADEPTTVFAQCSSCSNRWRTT